MGTDTVLGRPCKKVRVTLGKMVEELSVDPSLQFPIKDYAKSMAMLNRVPGPMGTLFKRVYQETAKLKGVPLRTHITGLMGMDVTTEATAIVHHHHPRKRLGPAFGLHHEGRRQGDEGKP